MVESLIDSAISDLREAQSEAEMGTGLMIKSRISDLENLRQRVSNLNDDNENNAERDAV